MKLQRHCLFLVLAAALSALSGSNAEDPASLSGSTFQVLPAVRTNCTPRVELATVRSEIECASHCSRDWRSFSLINGICVLSDSSSCADSDAELMWMKSPNAASTDPSNICSANHGYEQLIGARRFCVFQQRKTGAVNFARNWTDYERGFGDQMEFWSGMQAQNSLTARGNVTLRIEMTALNGILYVAEWSNFTVGDASTNYTMQYTSLLTASSNVSGDALATHRGAQFSTFDRDNDNDNGLSDSVTYGGSGGFWFNQGVTLTPNALYSTTEMRSSSHMSCFYIHPTGGYNTLREMRMMLQLN